MGIKVVIFFLTIISVKYIFISFNEIGDKKLVKMKELIDFTEYLKIYSCEMKMSFEEILNKYQFRSPEIKNICKNLFEEIKIQNMTDRNTFLKKIKLSINTSDDFNMKFCEIIDYYGNTFSDVLYKKLTYTIKEMDMSMREFESIHKEKKKLLNRISLMIGCFAAIILI